MAKADELATLLGISDDSPEAYLTFPGQGELEAKPVAAVRLLLLLLRAWSFSGADRLDLSFWFVQLEEVKDFSNPQTEPVMVSLSFAFAASFPPLPSHLPLARPSTR